jgi:8-oxo-dGTP diphosphatase
MTVKFNMPFMPIVATLGYLLSDDGLHVLLIHRNKRANDAHLGKYNGLGGKLEPTESVLACMKREFLEEAGVHLEKLEFRGTVSWPGFGKHGEDWLGFVFIARGFAGTLKLENPEGMLEWVLVSRLLDGSLPMWDGDRHFLPLVFDNDTRPFHGVMPYENGRALSWDFER